ncbi:MULTISPECIES: AzlC family ABC transporter permease [Rhodovulum]|uniref:Branched-chain amino acid transporter AzlC n=2 Tax=Rhodovulum TaxID=34008 RepID=A0ABX9DCZ3_9RHOB|nr:MULTISPECIES: AzlC family ABC transporter permease [Rhodovulum]PTW51980.1 putative branched-subunit amino acid permease [Rhodovulum kholense]RAP40195.1 branched-chain amino acid transporter AzlC [Rhodovulum viride]
MTEAQAFRKGALDCAPFILIVVPFSLLFGVVARDAGLDLLQAMAMSVLVIAGASQFTALALLEDHAPVFVALLAALAVNLRMAMYSAALVPYLGHARLGVRALMAYLMVDQAFAVAVRTYEAHPAMTPAARVAYYFGCMVLICPFWYGGTLTGALVGQAIPAEFSLDFAVPVCFIALTAPLIRSLPHAVAALVSALAALALAWLPWSLGLPVAALVAMITGAQTERLLQRRGRA